MRQESETARFNEKHYSASEIAERWDVLVQLVRDTLCDEPGVLRVFSPRNMLQARVEDGPRP